MVLSKVGSACRWRALDFGELFLHARVEGGREVGVLDLREVG
jgi:hypothetical protein